MVLHYNKSSFEREYEEIVFQHCQKVWTDSVTIIFHALEIAPEEVIVQLFWGSVFKQLFIEDKWRFYILKVD